MDRDLAEIAGFCERATPGPWFTVRGNDNGGASFVAVSVERFADGLWFQEGGLDAHSIVAATLVVSDPYVFGPDERWDQNAEFIAAARTALPKLVDEVQTLRDRVRELEAGL